MKRKSHSTTEWPEILFTETGNHNRNQTLSRAAKQGQLRQLARGIYTSNLQDAPGIIIRRHLFEIVGHFYPEAIISHRSALEINPSPGGDYFLTYRNTRSVNLPGVRLRLTKGPLDPMGTTPFMGTRISDSARSFLENLEPARTSGNGDIKTLGREAIETKLMEQARIHGPDRLENLRKEAEEIADALGFDKPLRQLEEIVDALQGKRKARVLSASAPRALALGEPYDGSRLELFQALFHHLRNHPLPAYSDPVRTQAGRQNAAFFDAYFSNYIEGTTFTLEEAEGIVFRGDLPDKRPADAHDVLGTYRLLAHVDSLGQTPADADSFLALLQQRHGKMMAGRPEIDPGTFKTSNNKAGNTVFVAPNEVPGTLRKGAEMLQGLTDPLARAIFTKFLISEVHPFKDGNGRVSRLMANSELVAKARPGIIIPTGYREDYLSGLKRLSQKADPTPFVAAMVRAHQFTAELPFEDYGKLVRTLNACRAFEDESKQSLLRLPSELPANAAAETAIQQELDKHARNLGKAPPGESDPPSQ